MHLQHSHQHWGWIQLLPQLALLYLQLVCVLAVLLWLCTCVLPLLGQC
jgi:hypothetical protein